MPTMLDSPGTVIHTGVPIGTIIGSDFEIASELASGGMGVIYVARQLSTGRTRALKMIHPTLVRDDELRRRFEQEARVGSRIESEHVVEVIGAGVDAPTGMPWIAMELLEGEDLLSCLTREGPLDLERTAHILAQLFHALEAAHQVGVVHRDLKPENVFLKRSRREGPRVTVKLLDLGIAKIVADARGTDTAAVGTPLWMAPEQTGGKIGPATDVWALGLLTFWMLTGKSYWLAAESGAPVMGVLREVITERLPPASERASQLGVAELLPPGFDEWFAGCVARDPKDRFRNAGEARVAFERVAAGNAGTVAVPVSGRTGDAPRPKGRRRRPALAALALAAAALASAVVWRTRHGVAEAGSTPAKPSEIAFAISANPPGASIFLDGKRLPSNPVSDRRPRDGTTHRLRVEAEQYQPAELEIAYDDDVALELMLDPLPRPASVSPVAPAASSAQTDSVSPRAPKQPPKGTIAAASKPPAPTAPSPAAKPSSSPAEPGSKPAKPPGPPIDTDLPWNEKKN